jgi:hypothetical protein
MNESALKQKSTRIENTASESTTGKPLRVTIRRENGTFFAHLLLRPPVAARFRRLARKAGVSLEAVLQLSIEQAARHFAA